MRAVDIVRRKRDGLELSPPEISFLIRGYSTGSIPDYQMAAFLMSVFFRGMSEREVASLTEEMRTSGEVVDLDSIPGRKVDKHSTGGVGDKTSLIIAPVVASCGVTVPMVSGRGLGHTGGTLDKLESIPGFQVRLSLERFRELLAAKGLSFIGQTDTLVPADRKLYSLRDVTATVESRPLIVASIMSKKLAEGIDGLVLDVKTGSGAFMKSQEDAEILARAMVGIGIACGKQVVALITDMDQPLGEYAGNALEVVECIEVMKGRGASDLVSLSEELSAHCLVVGGAAANPEKGASMFRAAIASGRALDRFRDIIRLQGGDPGVTEDYSVLPQARNRAELPAASSGFIKSMDTQQIGLALCVLGAGRETVDSVIDPAVGIKIHKKIGDPIDAGESLCTIYYNDDQRFEDAREKLAESYGYSPSPVERPVLVKKIISRDA